MQMRHIAHSPVAGTGYLRDALRELRFHKVMERFGTFFLHEMDLERAAVLRSTSKTATSAAGHEPGSNPFKR